MFHHQQLKLNLHHNILFLQLESFFDPTLVNYLELSEDPIPNFRKLMKVRSKVTGPFWKPLPLRGQVPLSEYR